MINNIIPKLRFSEFTDEWQKKRLSQIVRFSRGGSLSKADLNKSGKYKAIHYGELFTQYSEVISSIKSRTDVKGGVDSEIDDILMPTSDVTPQGLARASVIKEDGVKLGGDINILKPNYNVSPVFLSYVLNSQKKKIIKIVSGTTVRHVYNSDLAKICYYLPMSKPEQQKIADFLTAVDDKISAIDKKVESLKQYKKGVMQKIFAQAIRFRDEDGIDYPDWEIQKLRDIFERITNKNIENNQNILTISAQQGLIRQDSYFNKVVAAKSVVNYYLIQKNDFAYNKSYSVGYPMGAIKRLKLFDKGIVSSLYICFRIKNNQNTEFFEHAFDFGLQNSAIEKVAQEGVRNHGLLNISIDEFFSVGLNIPESRDEQRKLADFLTKLDDKINLTEQKLNQTKQFKKALLQRMFV